MDKVWANSWYNKITYLIYEQPDVREPDARKA